MLASALQSVRNFDRRSRLLMTLVALFAMTAGAWAQATPLITIESTGENASFKSGSKTFDDKVTVTFSDAVGNDNDSWGWYTYSESGITLTVTAAEGYTITRVKFYNNAGSAFDASAPFEAILVYDNGVVTKVNGTSLGKLGVTKIEVYGYAGTEPPLEVTWNAATKTGTFDMPASDVVLTPIYAPVAQWATENEVELLPTAAEGIFAGTTDPIIVEGTVAPGQGTVMYAVTTDATTAPTLAAFSADVPTAENIADDGATVYVWYYIQGAATPDGQEATAENTFNDSEICATPLEVSVLSNQFDITFNAANANTIESGKATVTVGGTAATVTEGKLEAVKMGSEVKMTAKQGYKFRKVEAKKKAAVTYTLLSAATTDDIGKVVCAAGHLHDAKTAVPDGCTAVGIIGKVTETGHGLILALQDATSQSWNTINGWTSETTYAGTTLKVLPDDAARGSLTSYTTLGETTVSNWAVAQKSDYDAIFTNLGSTIGDSDGTTYDDNVNAYITTGVGGTAISDYNWSATSYYAGSAWYFRNKYWDGSANSASYSVRPVLGF